MRFVLDLLYLFAFAAYSPIIIYRAVRHNRYRSGWGQRFGKIGRRSTADKCIWLHAVSVGEVNAAKTVIQELEERFSNFEIVISTTTDTGFARASNLFSAKYEVFYFPFDFSLVVHRAFANIHPTLCLLMELEIWPNFIGEAHRRNIPVVVVNGRISPRSFPKYRRIKPFLKGVFRKVNLVLAQTNEYAQCFMEIGAISENVIVTGSLKYDTAQITDKVEGTDALAARLGISNERLWVAGATGPGEEEILLDVFKQLIQPDQFEDLRFVIVPRKPERFDEVAQKIIDAGFEFVRYSKLKNTQASKKAPDPFSVPVILGDTMGDLRKFYCLASVIFVGRSLVPLGGSDMMEAAALGKCTIFGPHAFNFEQTVNALLADEGAIMVKNPQELLLTMKTCLSEPELADKIALNGREVIRKNQGATAKTIEQITKLLNTA